MINEKYPESELTGRIIGCCMEVHKIMGNGFQEVIYPAGTGDRNESAKIEYSREIE